MSRHPLVKACNRWSRRLHRWAAVAAAAPLLVVISTGLLLQWKKELAWVQPPERRGGWEAPSIELRAVLDAARAVPEAGVSSWEDIDRLDVRPSRGIVKVLCNNRWELQLDAHSGELLSSAPRRSDLIESLHDGSWFHAGAKHWVFFPAGLLLLGLWVTGVYLWALPIAARRRGRGRGDQFGAAGSGRTSTSTSAE